MRILHVLNDVTDQGNGIINAAIDLTAGQVEQGHTVAIASAGGGHEPLLRRLNIKHLALDQTRRPAQLMKAVFTLNKHIRDFQPDVVHVHMRTSLLIAWLVTRFTRHPLIAHVQNVHERESALMRLADRVVVCSASVGKSMQEMGVPQAKIHVVLNAPLHSPRLPSLDSTPAASIEHPAIVTVCGMYHRKGIADLIAAFEQVGSQIKDAHLYMVGNGPEMELFQQQAKAGSVSSRIHFEGFQPTPQAYMRAAEIFVLASRRESFGLVLVEARQAGCAVIASDVDGIPEALDEGEAGILFPPSDIPQLANDLIRLLENHQERKSWQQKALIGIERFHYTTMARGVSEIYRELFPKNSSARSNRVELPVMKNN
jgi:glycosyltransferase involved in cell wall biosynthesis